MLTPADSVLLIVDVQGKLAGLMHEKERLFGALEVLIQGCRALSVPVVWCEQVPEKLGRTVEPVARHLDDLEPIAKAAFSCCGSTEVRERLEELGRGQVLVAGIEAHVCVHQTVRDLRFLGYHVEVVADAVSSRTPENRDLGLRRMEQAGASLTSVEMALFEMLGTAEHPAAREIFRLVR